jgi:hypothetical protein
LGALGLFLLAVAGSSPAPASPGGVPTAQEIRGPSAVVPLVDQPPAKIIVDPPLPEALARGLVVIQYRTENLRILPVFGAAAVAVSPRIGHLHVTVDDSPWHWADSSNQELIINGLAPGPHKIQIELADANHKVLAQEVVKFEVPRRAARPAAPAQNAPQQDQPPAKIIVDPPQPDRLARGVVFIQYRTKNVQIAPVFGAAALAVSPRLGHLHITVDDSPWRWADASGGPLIVAGLPSGPHKILLEVADPNHKVLTQSVVKFQVP